MDYIFRWLNLRFLSGEQLTLFAGLAPQAAPLPESPTILPDLDPEEDPAAHKQLSKLAEDMIRLRDRGMGSTSAPAGSIPPEAQAASTASAAPTHGPTLQDRGLFHASEAMRSMYEMGDAPSCSTCGAIMVRNGSCYRCMSCGSTSGCS
jgi:ribonucleoside-diphosphate reductase alpha chain